MHKKKQLSHLSLSEALVYRQIIMKKLRYYQDLYDEAALVEAENQDDYGLLATVQAEMDFAERKGWRYEKKKELLDQMIAENSFVM